MLTGVKVIFIMARNHLTTTSDYCLRKNLWSCLPFWE